jgi:hypothetical protein
MLLSVKAKPEAGAVQEPRRIDSRRRMLLSSSKSPIRSGEHKGHKPIATGNEE